MELNVVYGDQEGRPVGQALAPRNIRTLERQSVPAFVVFGALVTGRVWCALGLGLGWATSGMAQGRSGPSAAPQSLPGIQKTPAPWIREIAHLAERLNAIGLPALKSEGQTLHIHQHLRITVQGQPAAVPAGIGINEFAGFIASIHTHDTTGVIHIESPTVQPFTLGQFFDVWGVLLTARCIGGYCSAGVDSLRVFSNGAPVRGDPRRLELAQNQDIVVTYGGTVSRKR